MTDYSVNVPEGVSGNWAVKKFTVDPEQAKFDVMRSMFGGHGRHVPVGTYTALYCYNSIIMSDTPDEIRDHAGFMRKSSGSVLIAGLGLGMVLQGCAVKDEVTHVTVVEKSSDVISLVKEHYLSKPFGHKLEIIQADIFDWKPSSKETKFDFAWYDIWNDLCTDNLTEMTKLHRKFARRVTNQGSWGKELLKDRKRRERNSPWYR